MTPITGWITIIFLGLIMGGIALAILHPIWKNNRDIPWPILIYFILAVPVGSLLVYLWLGRPALIGLF